MPFRCFLLVKEKVLAVLQSSCSLFLFISSKLTSRISPELHHQRVSDQWSVSGWTEEYFYHRDVFSVTQLCGDYQTSDCVWISDQWSVFLLWSDLINICGLFLLLHQLNSWLTALSDRLNWSELPISTPEAGVLSAWSITHSSLSDEVCDWKLKTDPQRRMWSEWTLLMLRQTQQRTTWESDSYTWGPSQVIMGCADDDVTLLDCEWAAG